MATKTLGLSEDAARSATAGILDFVGKNAGRADFQELVGKVPGAAELMQQGAAATSGGSDGGGGLLGGLAGMASSALGGNLGAGAGLLGMLQNSGLDAGKAASFVPLLAGFLREKAGADLVNRVLGSVPALKQFLG